MDTTLQNNPAIGESWNDLQKELFTPEEIEESKLRVALIGELIQARQSEGLSQRDLERLTGIRQPAIARIESGKSCPSIDTVMRLLRPLGKTLAIVPLKES